MKNKIISAILEIKKAGARKIPLGSAEYYAPFEELYKSAGAEFCAVLTEIRKDVETEADVLLHAMRLSAYFGVKTETLASELRDFFEKCFILMESEDVYESRDASFRLIEADELLKSFAGGTKFAPAQMFYKEGAVLPSFENFISLSEVKDIQTAGLYDLCADLHLVKPSPKYIKDAMRASLIIDGLYGTVPWEYYLEHASLAKIGRDTELLKKVGFEKIPQMLCDILAKMNEAKFSSRKEKTRFCEKICLKNKSYIENIMAEEKKIIEKYIIFQNLLKK